MLSPEATAAYVEAYRQAAAQQIEDVRARRRPMEKRLAELDRKIDRIIDTIADGLASDALKERLTTLEIEKAQLQQQLAEPEIEPQIELHPSAAENYAKLVSELEANLDGSALESTPAARRLREAVRGLVRRVSITPLTQQRGGPIDIQIEGTLEGLLAERGENNRLGGVVAGGGIEPPTCGL